MGEIWREAKRGLAVLWRGLREWCGDAAYENYKECATRAGQERVLSAAEFYVEQLNRKYSKPTRCC
jgi:Selenoprotein, putative